jgi:hypothetical protein
MRIMHLMKPKKLVKYTAIGLLVLLIAGLLWQENLIIPVKGATKNDWNHQTFWYEPWGSSGVHKGIDIFGKTGAEVVASTAGIVVFSGQLPKGGNAIAVLGPKWRIHYFAHLNTRLVPVPWLLTMQTQGWKRMFFLSPHESFYNSTLAQ